MGGHVSPSTDPARVRSHSPIPTLTEPGLMGLGVSRGAPTARQGRARRRAILPSPATAFRKVSFPALAPEQVFTPPTELIDALADAERIMVIGHAPADGDCVGTALGTARALRALGKQACAVVDTKLPRNLAGLDGRGDLMRAEQVEDFDPDLVLLVDVAQPERIGDAVHALRRATQVAIIDHHKDDPTAESLQLEAPDDATITPWIDEHADSASLMAAAALRVLAARTGQLEAIEGDDIHDPWAAGAATDTNWFEKSTARSESLSIFKHLLEGSTGRMRGLQRRLTYELPAAARHLLDRTVQVAVRAESGQEAMWIIADERTTQEALHLAQAEDPEVSFDDISGALMNRLDEEAKAHGVALLLRATPDGKVRVSIRSRDPEVAGEIARTLGGGGKHGAGAAVVDSTIVGARREVLRALEQWNQQQTGQLRLLGSR